MDLIISGVRGMKLNADNKIMKYLKYCKNIIALFVLGIIPLISKAVAVKYDNPLKATSFTGLMNDIADFLLLNIAPPIATIMVLWSAFLFMTSGGNEQKLTLAKKTLMWTVIGVTLLLLAKGIAYTIQKSLGI